MSSLETSSPVSASTVAYLMRWPVFLLIWLKLICSESEVAGYKATGQVTSERRKKPFQLARGAIEILQTLQNPDSRRSWLVGSDNYSGARGQDFARLSSSASASLIQSSARRSQDFSSNWLADLL